MNDLVFLFGWSLLCLMAFFVEATLPKDWAPDNENLVLRK